MTMNHQLDLLPRFPPLLSGTIVAALFVLQASGACAFDEKRKGFVLGFGIGGGAWTQDFPSPRDGNRICY